MKLQKVSLFLVFAFLFSVTAGADDWEILKNTTAPYIGKVSFEQIKKQLPVLAHPEFLESARKSEDSFLFESDGSIEINKEHIVAYDKSQSIKFSFDFVESGEYESHSQGMKESIQGIRIHLDTNSVSNLQKNLFGEMSFKEFATNLHKKVKSLLTEEGAIISESLRPDGLSIPQIVENQNQDPPVLTIGLWYSADNEDFMMSFCEGNVVKTELNTDLRKAAFIHSLITGKAANSVKLAACISGNCAEALNIPLLSNGEPGVVQSGSHEKTFFEGQARALKKDTEVISSLVCTKAVPVSSILNQTDGTYLDGIGARNTFPTKIMSRASVIAFPNRTVFQHGNIEERMENYAQSITRAVKQYFTLGPI